MLAFGAIGTASLVQPSTPAGPGVTAEASSAQREPASPAMRLASAITASKDISYRIRVSESGPGGRTFEGAFDPRTDTGYVRMPQDDSVMTELLISGTRYVGGEPPLVKLPRNSGLGEKYGRYGQYPGTYDRLSLYGSSDGVLGAAASDPEALLTALSSVSATITKNPDGTLHFEYGTQDKHSSTATSGDVSLNGDGRIAKVVSTVAWQSTVKGRLDKGTVTSTLELFDYGVEVTVKRPTDVVMHKE
ncbi:hypothetical protein JNW90_32115 [Micromonospora sp. STR1s_5]|nr:hypothetical protein [Micromonospora sp. STR1s_5]